MDKSDLSFINIPYPSLPMTETQLQIAAVCDDIKELLLYKNKQYGDSALNPSRIFSKSNAVEQLLVRIDDKLNRIKKGAGLIATDEDVIQDLIGYLVLLRIGLNRQKEETNEL
jgi:hypothetical protein